MDDLAEQKCVPCRGGAEGLNEAEIAAMLSRIPGWNVERVDGVPRLTRIFRFPDFAAALAFTQAVGAEAETEDHHPAILLEWGRATVSWWTHSVNGLHANDFILAARCDRIYLRGWKQA